MADFISGDFNRIVENFAQFGIPADAWGDTALSMALGAAGLALGGAGLRKLMRRMKVGSLPAPNLGDEIPFNFIDDDGATVDCDRAGAFCVIEVEGVSYSNLTEEERENLKRIRASWLTRLAMERVEAVVITSRQRMVVGSEAAPENEYLKVVNDRWLSRFSDALVNRNYIVISAGGRNGKARVAAGRDVTLEQMDAFKPKLLRHRYSETNETESELWNFLSWLVNGRRSSVAPHDSFDLAESLSESEIRFDPKSGTVSVHDGRAERFTRAVGLKALPQRDDTFLQALTRLPYEMDVYQWAKPRGSHQSVLTAERKKRNALMFMGSPLDSEEYDEVHKLFAADRDAYCDYEITVFVHAASAAELDKATSEVVRALGRRRFTPVVERVFCEEAFFNRWPGRTVPLRRWEPNISNVADWTPLEGTSTGLARCWWGPRAFREFRSIQGTPYAFGIHSGADDEAPGSGIIIGGTGKGKSVFMAFLMSGAQTNFPGCRVIVFDNNNGMRIPTEAFGGKVVAPGAEARRDKGMLAPLQLADTPENREFLTKLLLEMAQCDGPANEEVIADGLAMFMQIDREKRTLERFYNECLSGGEAVAVGLKQWFGDGAYAGWLDGDEDVIDVLGSPWVTFNLSRVASNPRLTGVFTSYILHLIKTVLWRTGKPHFVFMDEASALIAASPLFADQAAFLFREIRRHKGVFWLAFQEGGNLGPTEQAFVKNATNYVFLRDPNADAGQLAELYGVSSTGTKFIRNEEEGAMHVSRGVLHVRKTSDGKVEVPLDVNLSGLGNLLSLFRSSDEHVIIQQRFKREYGDKWVGPYLQDVERLYASLQSAPASSSLEAAE